MFERITQNLARLIPRQKANPAGEGNWHPGPYTVSGGVLPSAWGQFLNYWQMDYDPIQLPSNSIVEACTWAYIRAVAQLPGHHKKELGNGGTETVTTSALSRVLRAPNGYQSPSDFLVHLVRSLLLTGNSYWIAQRNDRHEVTALHWTDPRHCRVREARVQGQPFSEVFYEISDNPLLKFESIASTPGVIIPARDVFHVKLATPCHPLVGETWLKALALELANRNSIGNAASTFANNQSRPSGVITTDLVLTSAQTAELKERWNAASVGLNAGGVPILTHGLKFQPMGMSNEDAQLIEQLKLNDRTVAAVFGVPPMLVGISEGGSTKSAEAQMAEWLSSGLGWLINHIEVSLDQFFGLDVVPAGREWTEYDTRILLRAAFAERIEGLVRGVQGGVFSPNEARELEGYKAVEAGDEPRVQQQLVPLSWEPPEPAPAVASVQETPAAANDDEPADDEEDDEDQQQRAVIGYQLRAIMSKRDENTAA